MPPKSAALKEAEDKIVELESAAVQHRAVVKELNETVIGLKLQCNEVQRLYFVTKIDVITRDKVLLDIEMEKSKTSF